MDTPLYPEWTNREHELIDCVRMQQRLIHRLCDHVLDLEELLGKSSGVTARVIRDVDHSSEEIHTSGGPQHRQRASPSVVQQDHSGLSAQRVRSSPELNDSCPDNASSPAVEEDLRCIDGILDAHHRGTPCLPDEVVEELLAIRDSLLDGASTTRELLSPSPLAEPRRGGGTPQVKAKWVGEENRGFERPTRLSGGRLSAPPPPSSLVKKFTEQSCAFDEAKRVRQRDYSY